MMVPIFTRKYGIGLCLIAVLAAWLALSGGAVDAATLNAANNGVDSLTCGAAGSPCRSISQSIQNASSGDTILVGPGRYGDLDGDGNFTSAGEEFAEVGVGCNCMIKVTKPLTIVSRDGADATVLDAGSAALSGVMIQASRVSFGQSRKGFTVWRAGDSSGFVVVNNTIGVKIAGNVAKFIGSPCPCPPGVIGRGFLINGNEHLLSGNLSVNNHEGFVVNGADHRVTENLATENTGAGYFIQGSGHVITRNVANNSGGAGFSFDGTGFTITSNSAGASGTGFMIFGTAHIVRGNVASGNLGYGFDIGVSPGGITLTRNAARGNTDAGIHITAVAVVTDNDIYGNNETPSFLGFTNCGLLNESGAAVTATNNFWGAPTGPGANPADDVCDSGGGSVTTTAPFAAAEIPVNTFPIF
jgi:parallel beta-helix repeat protein